VGAVASDQEERNRLLGVPVGPVAGAELGRESQRVLGFPVDSFGPVDQELLDVMRHPVRTFRRWRQRRAQGL
jgi:hypothetical protein